jgi:hypothetical protein
MRRVMWGIAVVAIVVAASGSAWAGTPGQRSADVGLFWTYGGNPIRVGSQLDAGLAATNAGPGEAHGVQVKVRFSSGFRFLGTAGRCQHRSARFILCWFGRVANAEQTSNYGFELNPIRAGTGRVSLTIVSQTTDPNLANNHVVLQIPIEPS